MSRRVTRQPKLSLSSTRRRTTHNTKSNIQVIVRCRPLHSDENVKPGTRGVNAEIKLGQKDVSIAFKTKVKKRFIFDRVYGQRTTQNDIFSLSIRPLVDEVLKGYNATCMAYGQTNSGKTFTMEGHKDYRSGKIIDGGIIPRSIEHIFNIMGRTKNVYTLRISCIELYNEELSDLLSNRREQKLRIYNDAERGGTFVHGATERSVDKVEEVISLLEIVSRKRQSAETKMNKHSSRSHVITTITIHITEMTEDGEEMIKTGKLNLVDLAGSENVRRSGTLSSDIRSREASSINKSLLTLGRVITSLGQRQNHVPYRESKLTRLLQDSLGGNQKTIIIACVSTARKYVEETLSTLDYAHIAKSIENTPVQNCKVPQERLARELMIQMDDLKNELELQRAKQGVYLPVEAFEEFKQSKERLEEVENQLKIFRGDYDRVIEERDSLKEENYHYQRDNSNLRHDVERKSFFLNKYQNSEEDLYNTGKELTSQIRHFQGDYKSYRSAIQRKQNLEERNVQFVNQYQRNSMASSKKRLGNVENFYEKQKQFYQLIRLRYDHFHQQKEEQMKKLEGKQKDLSDFVENNFSNFQNMVNGYSQISLDEITASTLPQFAKDMKKWFHEHQKSFEKIQSLITEHKEESTRMKDQLHELITSDRFQIIQKDEFNNYCQTQTNKLNQLQKWANQIKGQVMSIQTCAQSLQEDIPQFQASQEQFDAEEKKSLRNTVSQSHGRMDQMNHDLGNVHRQVQNDVYLPAFQKTIPEFQNRVEGQVNHQVTYFQDDFLPQFAQSVKTGVSEYQNKANERDDVLHTELLPLYEESVDSTSKKLEKNEDEMLETFHKMMEKDFKEHEKRLDAMKNGYSTDKSSGNTPTKERKVFIPPIKKIVHREVVKEFEKSNGRNASQVRSPSPGGKGRSGHRGKGGRTALSPTPKRKKGSGKGTLRKRKLVEVEDPLNRNNGPNMKKRKLTHHNNGKENKTTRSKDRR